MQSINQEVWSKLTDEQRRLIHCIIREFLVRNGELGKETADLADCDHLEIEHWFTGEL